MYGENTDFFRHQSRKKLLFVLRITGNTKIQCKRKIQTSFATQAGSTHGYQRVFKGEICHKNMRLEK